MRLGFLIAATLCVLVWGCGPATSDPPAYVPVESRLLGLNDVTFLLPLEGLDAAGMPPPRALVPVALFDRLSTLPGDVLTELDRLRVVALRFDLCDRDRPGPCEADADGSLRLVLQPLLATGEAEDVAFHAFYPVPRAEMPRVVDELRRLARLQDVPRTAPLQVNTAFVTDGSWRTALVELVARYAQADRLHRLTLFGQLTRQAALVWVFRGVELQGGSFKPIAIAGLDAEEQIVRLFSSTSYTAEPEADNPSGLLHALSDTGYDRADETQKRQALETLAAVDNPTHHTANTVQCVACHVSTTVLASRASLAGVEPNTLPTRFASTTFDLTPLGEETLRPRTLRALGYLQKWPMVSQRVINETANAIGELEQRHPAALSRQTRRFDPCPTPRDRVAARTAGRAGCRDLSLRIYGERKAPRPRLASRDAMTDTARLPLLTTREVASRLGVSEATIKRWSDAGSLPCERTPGGHRKFRPDEVERVARHLHGLSTPVAAAQGVDPEEVCQVALAGDAVALYALAQRWMNQGGRLDALFDLVLGPALAQVGQRWAVGTATVADEHTASAAVGEVVDRLAAYVTPRPLRGTAISACLAGEHHGLASRMCGLLLREAGYHALVPGPDTPDDALLALIEGADARVVCLSASCLMHGDPSLAGRVEKVRAALSPRGARLLVGGEGFAPPSFETVAPTRYLVDMRALSAALRRT